ncbi:MAG: hypothetical protein AAB381_02020 [Patescibacteria group bacterium]
MPRTTSKGFIALIAVCMLVTGTLAGTVAILVRADAYADTVRRREMRIQRRLDVHACLDTVNLMITRDVFLRGAVYIRDFDCRVYVDSDGRVTVIE